MADDLELDVDGIISRLLEGELECSTLVYGWL